MAISSDSRSYSIGAVSKLTGVSCHALRVWQKRYGFPEPDRTKSGHRRYRPEQIEILQQIAKRLPSGQSIKSLMEELVPRRSSGKPILTSKPAPRPSPEYFELIEVVIAGDMIRAESLFADLASRFDLPEFVNQVIAPAFVEVGERWFRGECWVFEEHVVTAFLRRKLELLIEAARSLNVLPKRRVVIASCLGERHEGGRLIASLMLERGGWKTIDIGADIPISEIAQAVERFMPDALAVSFVLSRNINKRFQELSAIDGVPIFVAGRSILNYQGLARRHGLIPLLGPVEHSVAQMSEAVGNWKALHQKGS